MYAHFFYICYQPANTVTKDTCVAIDIGGRAKGTTGQKESECFIQKVARKIRFNQCVSLRRQSVNLEEHCWKFARRIVCIVMSNYFYTTFPYDVCILEQSKLKRTQSARYQITANMALVFWHML